MNDVTIRVRREGLSAWLVELRGRARDLRPFWPSPFAYMAIETAALFDHMGHDGGTFRGVTWPGFADQYTRKTDGVTVPAEGGVPRIAAGFSTRGNVRRQTRPGVYATYAPYLTGVAQDIVTRRFIGGRSTGGEGMVRGRLRPSGARVDESSLLVQNTRATMVGATTNYRATPRRLVMFIPDSVGYARYQHEMRPILFMTDRDVDRISEDALDYVFGGSATSPGQAAAPAGSILERLRAQSARS